MGIGKSIMKIKPREAGFIVVVIHVSFTFAIIILELLANDMTRHSKTLVNDLHLF